MFNMKKKAEDIKLVNDDVADRQEIKFIYVKVECRRCGKTFGISPTDNMISEKDIVCQKCLKDKMFS